MVVKYGNVVHILSAKVHILYINLWNLEQHPKIKSINIIFLLQNKNIPFILGSTKNKSSVRFSG